MMMHIFCINEFKNGLSLMKYAVNHSWKFSNYRIAFLSGLLQACAMVLVTVISYIVITIESSVIDVAKDFTALTIIAEFDNFFGAFGSGEELPKAMTTEKKYRWIFRIETTTSKDAEREKDADIGEDWVFEEIKKRREREIEQHEKFISATGDKPKL